MHVIKLVYPLSTALTASARYCRLSGTPSLGAHRAAVSRLHSPASIIYRLRNVHTSVR
ncbi:hypothetical protein ACFSF3_25955 [Vibrio chagasii]